MKIRHILPLSIFILITGILWRGLSLHPNQVSSPLIGKQVPSFSLPALLTEPETVTDKELHGQIILLNVWATWCYACAVEHDFLLELSKQKKITLYGLNYKDDPNVAKKWLKMHGNPYDRIAEDTSGNSAINWGVYGTPETFIIDQNGIIRYKQIGPITPEIWERDINPVVNRLRNEM